MKFEVYRDEKREWRWRLKAPNGNVIANSGEGYKNRVDCIAMTGAVSDLNQDNVVIEILSPHVSQQAEMPKPAAPLEVRQPS